MSKEQSLGVVKKVGVILLFSFFAAIFTSGMFPWWSGVLAFVIPDIGRLFYFISSVWSQRVVKIMSSYFTPITFYIAGNGVMYYLGSSIFSFFGIQTPQDGMYIATLFLLMVCVWLVRIVIARNFS